MAVTAKTWPIRIKLYCPTVNGPLTANDTICFPALSRQLLYIRGTEKSSHMLKPSFLLSTEMD